MNHRKNINKVTARQICKQIDIPYEIADRIVDFRRNSGPICKAGQLWLIEGMTTEFASKLTRSYSFHKSEDCDLRNVYDHLNLEKKQTDPGTSNTGGENVSKVESKSKKQFDTVIFIDKTGKRLTKRAKSVFLQESDSGDKLVLQCNGLKEFENLSSVTKKEASTSAKSVRRRATGKRKRKRRGRKKEGFSNTVSEIKFWDKIYTQLGTIKSKNIQSKNTSTAVNVSGEKEENRNESPKSVSRKSPKNTSSANDLLRLSREKIENIDRWLSTLEVPDIHKKGLEHTNTEVKDDELSNEEKADMEKRRDGSPQPGTSGAVTRDVVDKKTKHYERDDVRRKYRHRVDASDGVRERYIRHVRRKDRHKTAKSKSSCVVM